jgi:ribonuclease P protein component
MESLSFPKDQRLLKRKDFVNLNRFGERYNAAHFTIILEENGLNVTRLGITVSKKIGKAVKRNRVKRHLREFFRSKKELFPKGYDIVIVAKKGAESLGYWKINEELSEIGLDK